MLSIKNKFSSEFLDRLDGILEFSELTEPIMKSIIIKEIDLVKDKLHPRELTYSKEVVDYFLEKFKIENKGARPIKRFVESEIEDVLIDDLIENNIKEGLSISFFVAEDGTLKHEYIDTQKK